MGEWTIVYDPAGANIEKSLADWKLTDLARVRVSQGMDTCTLIAGGRAVDALELFDYGKRVIVYKDRTLFGGVWSGGTRWFYGRVDPWDRSATGESEEQMGGLVNPWWYLREKVFEQVRNVLDFIDSHGGIHLKVQHASRIVLGQKINSSGQWLGKFTVAEQVAEIINWAISEGAPIQLGTIDGQTIDGLPYYFPLREVNNITCEEALRTVWRWIVDAVFYWDYSTQPYPTLHMRQAVNLSPISYAISKPITELKIKERKDWRRPFARFIYEQENNGYLATTEDIWPNPLPTDPELKFAGMTATVPLIGFNTVTQSATLNCVAINDTDPGWWSDRIGWLKEGLAGSSPQIASVTLATPKRESCVAEDAYDTSLGNELLEVNLPDWLPQFKGQRIRVSCKATVVYANGTKPRDLILTHEFTATNAVSGDYVDSQVTQYADAVPVGLAKRFYEAFNALAVTGSLTTQEKEAATALPILSGALDTWHTLNFTTPDQPGWATVNALPQQIEERATTGEMRVDFGAPEYLTVNALIDVLRVARGPLVLISISTRPGGFAPGGSAKVSAGKKAAQKNSDGGGGEFQKLVISTPAGVDGQYKITHDAELGKIGLASYDASGLSKPGTVDMRVTACEGRNLTIQWVPICINGQQYRAKVLMSNPEPV